MPFRLEPPKHPVLIRHDGAEIVAERGEPLAVSLLAADRTELGRSPKLHRPRGPYCLQGSCEGCLARVNGAPNVMTCMRRVEGGEVVETQNVLGSRNADLLRATDFFFPSGFDHHRLLAGVPVVSGVVQSLARRIAGLGQLPEHQMPVSPAKHYFAEVAVVGGGGSGLTLATELANRVSGPVHLFEQATPGGNLRLLAPEEADGLLTRAARSELVVHDRTQVVGVYREAEEHHFQLLAVDERSAHLVQTHVLVLAVGCHDPVLLFENNDLPGVFSARAALSLLRQGVAMGEHALLVGSTAMGQALETLAGDKIRFEKTSAERLLKATGRLRVTGARLDESQAKYRGEAIIIDGEGPPRLELAMQAGLKARFNGSHFELTPESVRPENCKQQRAWAIGSMTRHAGEAEATENASTLVEAILALQKNDEEP